MKKFEFHNPIRLIFGCGTLDMVGIETKKYGKKALIVTSGSSGRTGLLQRVIQYVQQAGLDVAVFDKVQANPLTTMAPRGSGCG